MMLSYEETVEAMRSAAAVIKLICGVANNAAWLVALDGYDHARKCKNYRHQVKRLFSQAVDSYHEYERRLLYAEENRMFRLSDMSPEVRSKYGDITDREYYDFWAGMGAPAYNKTRPLLTSLWNKYRLSLLREGVQDAEHVAWVMVGMAAIELAVKMYGRAIDECEQSGIHRKILDKVFGQFSLAKTCELWKRALYALCPGTRDIEPSELDKRNITLGLEQLCDAWISPDLLYNSTMEAVADYAEIFRSKKEQKNAMISISEAKRNTMEELSNE